jgi:hypothetical protein
VEAVGDALAERMMDEGGGGHGLKYVNVRRAALWGQAQAARGQRTMSFGNELGSFCAVALKTAYGDRGSGSG